MKKQGQVRHNGWLKYILFLVCMLGAAQLGWMYHNDTQYLPVQVQEGDTVWQIASEISDNKTDVRQTVEVIMNRNNLSNNADIHPGQTIEVPVTADNAQTIAAHFANRK